MYKLKYFTEAEMRITKDTPLDIIQNCYNLAEFVLDPLRELVKKPILVNSWYRNPVYNAKVGGAKNSQHTLGEAADIVVKGMTVEVKGKAGDGTKLFGSITSAEIADAIKDATGYEIDKRKVVLNSSIKELGEYEIGLRIYQEMLINMKINVVKA